MKKLRRPIAFLMAVIMAMIFHFPNGLFPDIGLTAYAQETITEAITFSALDGTAGVTDAENYTKLIDGDKTSTKWCVTSFSNAYIVFQASEPISVDGYTITTGNDNATENGRNPKDWKLQGCNDYDAENKTGTWTDIDTVTGDTILQDENNTDYEFSVSTTDTKYQYFRLEITAIQSGSCMQMSEFTLSYSTCEHEWSTEKMGTIAPTCTEGGYDVFTCSKCGATKKVPNEEPLSGHTRGEDGKCTGCGAYMIESVEELKTFAAAVAGGNNSANALLTADITLNDAVFDENGNLKEGLESWTPIGREGYSLSPYTGTFDGQGHTISGLFFDDTSTDYVGLFCQVASAGSVLNVGIVDSYFQGRLFVGGICGCNYGTITNCYYTGTVSSTVSSTVNDGNSYYVGGICGYNGGTITNCYHVGTVSSTADSGSSYNVGGVCGYNNGTITNCYHAGTVSSTANNGDSYDVGGIYGYNGGVTSNCYYLSEKSGLKEKTKAQFNSGAVAYLLSQGCETNGKTYDGLKWGQNIGIDKYPVLGGEKVYATTGCVTYNNTKDTSAKQHSYENGICTGCGKYQEPAKDESNRYQISNLYEFYWFVDTINSGNGSIDAVLTNDITVNHAVLKEDGTLAENVSTFTTWTPIGSNDCPYNGTFDGQGHTISGLYLDDTSVDYVGLFGKVNSGSISNVGIVDSYLKGDEYVGGVCGYIMVSGGITNCYTTSVVSGSSYVGGLCGSNEGKITNCYFNNSVSGINHAVGYTSSGATCSKVSGKSTAQFASGEVAYRLNNATSEGSLVWGQKLSGEDADAYPKAYTGTNTVYATTGCVTYNNSGDTSAKEHQYNNNICTVCGKYEEPEKNENGVYQISKVYEMYWFVDAVNSGNNSIDAVLTMDITVNKEVLKKDGTLAEDVSTFTSWMPIGSNDYPYNGTFDGQGHTISGLFFNDTNSDYVGLFGIMAYSGRVSNVGIVDSYFEGDAYVGGICGENKGTITNCCITAAVKGNRGVGGVCGRNDYNGKVKNCYFNNSVSGTNEAVEFDHGTCSKVSGKSTEQFASGEVTYLLNNATSEGSLVWGQKLSGEDADAYPKAHTGTNTVYATTGCVTYNNSGDTRAKEHQYENGICKDCSEYEVPEKDENGVYQISNKGELYWFANTANSVTDSDAVLTRNIIVNKEVLKEDGTLAEDVSTFTSWTPIGRSGASYFGTFDGQGHTISGLYLKDTSANFVGLFGSVGYGGKILNVGIVDSYFNGGKYVGGVCGENYSTIQNCYNSGTVSGSGNRVGGVCGENEQTIQNCYNSGTVSGSGNSVGGVCGESIGTIQNCYNIGTVNGASTVGGVCGYSYYGKIVQCYNTGTVTEGNTPTYSISGSGGNDIIKCYYLYGGLGNETGCTSRTAEEFKNGTVCNEIGYHSHQNGICIQCGNYKEPDKKSESEYYEISDAGQLYWFADFVTRQDPSAKAVLTADITVNRDLLDSLTLDDNGSVTNGNDFTGWTPIGNSEKPYTGTFDGQGHTISGLFFDNTNSANVGLFGAVGSGGSVSKVGIVDSYLKGKNNVGGVSGANSGTITDCYNNAAVSGSTAVGGICGANSSTVTNCFNYYVAVSGTSNSVAVCGENNNTGTIKNCYYLAESETDDIDGTTCKTAAQFQSGAVAYLLNDSKTDGSQVWYQDIDKGTADAYPVLNNTHGVVYRSTPCTVVYSNTQDKRVEHIIVKVNDDSHKCQACGLEEVHTSAYSADDTKDTITVTCGGCHEEYGTVQLSAPAGDLTYDAAAKKASVTSQKTGSINLQDFTEPAITYKKGEEVLSSAPTDAGIYTASITLGAGTGAATVSVEYSIQQATPNIGTVSAETLNDTLDVSKVKLSHSVDTVPGQLSLREGTTLQYGTNDYTYVFTPDDAGNYKQVTGTVSITVNDTKCPDVEVKIKNTIWKNILNIATFGSFFKDTQYIHVEASDSGTGIAGTWYFVSSEPLNEEDVTALEAGDWKAYDSSDKPCLTKGTYYVYVKVVDAVGNTTYVGTDGIVIYEDAAPAAASIEYIYKENNDKTVAVTLKGNTVVAIRDKDGKALTVGSDYSVDAAAGTITVAKSYLDSLAASDTPYTLTVSYNPLDKAYAAKTDSEGKDLNDAPAETVISITVSKASLTVTEATATGRKYDTTDKVEITAVKLDGIKDTDSVSVDITELVGTLSSANAGSYDSVTLPALTLTGKNAGNYTLVQPTDAVTTNVTISRADAEIHVVETKYEKTFGDKAFNLGVTDINTDADTDVQYSVSGSKNAAGTAVDDNKVITVDAEGNVTIIGAGSAAITASLPESTNFNAAESKTITVTVNKAGNAPNKPENTMSVPYRTTKVSEITTLPTDWVWQDADKTKELTVGEAVTATAIYNGADKGNYDTESLEIAITRLACTHEGETEVRDAKAATCTEKGYTGDTYCKTCGTKISTGTQISELGHDFAAEFTVDTEATCITAGSKSKHCSRCDEKTEVTEIEKTAHTYVNGVCSVCDDIFETTVDGITYKVVTETGEDGKPIGKLVTVSGSETPQVAVAVTGTSEDFSENISDGKVIISGEITASGSEQTFVVTKISENAFNEAPVTEIVVPASVAEVGSGAFGEVAAVTFHGTEPPAGLEVALSENATINVPEGAKESYQEALGENADIVETHTHTFADEWSYDATGHWHASTCGHEEEIADKAEHTFGEWITVTEATEDATGLKERSCACGYKETAEIEKPAHTTHIKDEGTRVEPTCEEKGSITYKCTKCGEVMEVVELDAKGHTWDEGKVTKEATETEEGEKTYTCTVCSKTKTEAIPKKEAVTQEPPKEDTDTLESIKNGDVVCDDKGTAKYEILDTASKEAAYKEPVNKKAKTVSIPATVKIDGVTYKVTSIADSAFKSSKTVTKVTVGSNVKTIGKNAFSGAKKLKTVSIGKNAIEIGENAFKGCTSLTSVTLPSKTTKIGANAFNGCKKLKTIKITSTKLTSKTVSKNAFKGLTKATTIKVPKKKLSAYKKLFKSKGLSSKVKVKGY